MTELLALFGVNAVIAAALANIGIWTPRALWLKLTALVLLALFLPATYAAFAELMSRPKPVSIEWANRAVPEAVVLGSRLIEDKAIYIWLGIEGMDEPRAYALPWNQELAEQLHKAQRDAQSGGGIVMMGRPFDRKQSSLGERVFYPSPRDALPPKLAAQTPKPFVFKGRGQVPITND